MYTSAGEVRGGPWTSIEVVRLCFRSGAELRAVIRVARPQRFTAKLVKIHC
jgi:hypothetical protein